MTPQNSNKDANEIAGTKKNDPTTDTAYGDPVIASSPTINNEYKKATSTIAESTQNGSTGDSNKNAAVNENTSTKKKDTTTATAFGDPVKARET